MQRFMRQQMCSEHKSRHYNLPPISFTFFRLKKNRHVSSAAWFTAIMHLCLQNHNNFWFPSSFHLIKRSNINKTATALCWLILITIYSALHCQIYLILCHLVFNRVFAVPYVQLLMLWNARFRQKLKYHYIDNVWFFYKH